jgi:hypothetical protein
LNSVSPKLRQICSETPSSAARLMVLRRYDAAHSNSTLNALRAT